MGDVIRSFQCHRNVGSKRSDVVHHRVIPRRDISKKKFILLKKNCRVYTDGWLINKKKCGTGINIDTSCLLAYNGSVADIFKALVVGGTGA